MTELVEWLREQLEADKKAIVRYRDGHPGEPCTNSIKHDPGGLNYDEYDSCERHIKAAEASPYRDPSFGLADVDARLRVLDLHTTRTSIWWPDDECIDVEVCVVCSGHDYEKEDDIKAPCQTVRLLALPLAARPGYLSEWRPAEPLEDDCRRQCWRWDECQQLDSCNQEYPRVGRP